MDYEHSMNSADRLTQYEHELERMGVPIIPGVNPENAQPPKQRLVHLDLKGAPPKLSFLKSILPMIKTLGATGLLIEYEDMFPYMGTLQSLAAKNAYKVDELKDFLGAMAMNGLAVMPLVQTFGHMEYILKLHEFQELRESFDSPQSICPTRADSVRLLETMVTQIIEFHLSFCAMGNMSIADSDCSSAEFPLQFTHIHIGCDEVEHIGECEKCTQKSRTEIFLNHVITVSNMIRKRWPQIQIVIWDDMLREISLRELLQSHIGHYVEPMVWVYAPDVYHFISPQRWDIYSKVFPTVWAASSYKGAFGESLIIPPIQRHLENNMRWLAVMAREGQRFSKGFRGIVLTGWQRYDHFAVLCELLPTAIPSLIINLSTVSRGYFCTNAKDSDILRVLKCAFHADSRHSSHPWLVLNSNSYHSQIFTICTYPGSTFYNFIMRLTTKLLEIQNYLVHVQGKSAWMSDYNVRHNFSSPQRVKKLTESTPALLNQLVTLSHEAHRIMFDIYDEYTICEFIEQTIYPVIVDLQRHLDHAEQLKKRNTWVQRPLPVPRELVVMNLIPTQVLALIDQRDVK